MSCEPLVMPLSHTLDLESAYIEYAQFEKSIVYLV